jgi:hypothetical protein
MVSFALDVISSGDDLFILVLPKAKPWARHMPLAAQLRRNILAIRKLSLIVKESAKRADWRYPPLQDWITNRVEIL